MDTTINFTGMTEHSLSTNSILIGKVRKGSKKLKAIPSESGSEDFEISYTLTTDISECEDFSDSNDEEVFLDDEVKDCTNYELMQPVYPVDATTKRLCNGRSFRCSYRWSV